MEKNDVPRRPACGAGAPTSDWRTVWVVVAAGVVCAYHLGKVAIAASQLQSAFTLSLGMLGGLGSTFAIVGALGSVAAGSIVARTGDRRMLSGGLVAMMIGSVIAASTGSVAVLMLSRVVEGLGFLLVTVAGPTLIARITRGDAQGKALALWSGFMPTGMALAMLTGPWFSDWRSMWLTMAALSGVMAALVVRMAPNGSVRSSTASAPCAGLRHVWRSAALAGAVTFLLYSLMFFALFSFLPVLLQQRLQTSQATVGLLAALACGVNVLGNLATALMLKQVRRDTLICCVAAVMGVCALGIFLPLLGPVPALALCLVFSAVGGLIPATLLASVPQSALNPAQAALAMGMLMQGSNLGMALGPLLIGSAVARYGWSAAAAVVVAAALAMALSARRLHSTSF